MISQNFRKQSRIIRLRLYISIKVKCNIKIHRIQNLKILTIIKINKLHRFTYILI